MLLLPLVVIGAAFTGGIPEFNGWLAEHGVAGGKVALAPELGPGLRGMVASTDVQVCHTPAGALARGRRVGLWGAGLPRAHGHRS